MVWLGVDLALNWQYSKLILVYTVRLRCSQLHVDWHFFGRNGCVSTTTRGWFACPVKLF